MNKSVFWYAQLISSIKSVPGKIPVSVEEYGLEEIMADEDCKMLCMNKLTSKSALYRGK